MSFQITAEIEELVNQSGFEVADTAGIYHPTLRSGGWNGINPLMSSITAASLIVVPPDSITLKATGTPVTLNVLATLPNVAGNKYTATATALGYSSGKLPDGEYDITLKYEVGLSTSPTYKYYFFKQKQVFFGGVSCCVQSLAADIELGHCSKNTKKYRDTQDAIMYMRFLVAAADCFENNRAIEWLKAIKLICDRNPCGNC